MPKSRVRNQDKKQSGETFADSLSECSDCEINFTDSDSSDCDSECDFTLSRKRARFIQHSDSEKKDNGSKKDANVPASSNSDIAPYLEEFEGNSGVKIMPDSSDRIDDIVKLFINEDIFHYIVEESNRYHAQNADKYKPSNKTLKWKNITVTEMKKFFGLIVLMRQVKKDTIRDYWTREQSLETPFFAKVMSRQRFIQIMQSLHYCNNDDIQENSNRLVKVQHVLSYFKKNFNEVYAPKRELSLDENIISWRGRLNFRTYNPEKLTKYGILVCIVCEATTGYICNFEVHCTGGKKLEETMLSVLQPYSGLWHHIYQDNYYVSTKTAITLLKHKFRICGTIRNNKGVPEMLKNVKLAKNESKFVRNDDVLIQIWRKKEKTVSMISTIHSARMKDNERIINRRSTEIIQKPECIVEYSKYMKGVDRADQHLAHYNIFRKTRKWTNRVVMYFFNCALFNSFKVYVELNGKKMTYKKFLHAVALEWVTDHIPENLSPDNEEAGSSTVPTRRTSRFDHPGRLSLDVTKHKIVKIVTGGKKKIPQRQCKVCSASKIKSLTCFACKFCGIPLHKGYCFEQYHSRQNY